jgi:hypothetical protein
MSSPGAEIFLSLLFAEGYYIEIETMSIIGVPRFRGSGVQGSEDR